METSDDAGVYRIGETCALVETADIITPLVDDPFTFGRIAAANALSDVYAMGGTPRTAMNLAFFPACALPVEVLAQILAGGAAMMEEAGVCLVGGHTVEDDELKYGLAVTGLIDPGRIIRNSTARPGDRLFLTKPLGTGIVTTAIKGEMASAALEAEAVRWMTMLNSRAAAIMEECAVSACTDVTGFGLLGHASEMARGAGVTIRLRAREIPLIAGVRELVADGLVPAGCYRNRDYCLPYVAGASAADDALLPFCDPQTSGGLLVALPAGEAGRFLRMAAERGVFVAEIGEAVESREFPLELV